jgi:hypothetical protein
MPDETERAAANPGTASPEPQSPDIASLAESGFTDAEVERLRDAGLKTVADLCERAASDGLDDLEQKARVEGYRLIRVLPPSLAEGLADEYLFQAGREGIVPMTPERAKRRRLPPGRRARLAAGRAETWIRDHMLDLAFVGGVGLLAFLLLRAEGYLYALPSPWGLGTHYAVAAHDLRKGDVLHPAELHFVLLPTARDYFLNAEGLDGLILARDVPGQKPLRHEDLLRLQVVAVRDITPGEEVAASDLKLEWRPLQPTALLRAADAEHAKARLTVKKDDVVTEEHLVR